MFQWAGMREGGEPLPLAFQYLILMIWRHCDLNLVMISSLASKCQDFKVWMPFFQPFYEMKLKTSKLKVLAFWSQWRYHDKIQITRSLSHKNQIMIGKSLTLKAQIFDRLGFWEFSQLIIKKVIVGTAKKSYLSFQWEWPFIFMNSLLNITTYNCKYFSAI